MNDKDSLRTHYSRRTMIEATLGLLGAIALCGLETTRATAIAARKSPTLRCLTASEAVTIDALVAQIIPTDSTAGAREMGVVRFIDQALAEFLSPLAPEFRKQLADFQAECLAGHDGRQGFASLTDGAQIEWLRQVERTPFFRSLQQLTVLGALTMPQYGGNCDGLGWQLIGFDDLHAFTAPYGYYDRDYPGFSSRVSA